MNKEHTPERAVFEIQYSTRAEAFYANRTCWVLTWDAGRAVALAMQAEEEPIHVHQVLRRSKGGRLIVDEDNSGSQQVTP